ncbi:MAG TPA: DegT/DnrJ/EryC1/StrS family aminotransferase [Acidobacteriota bacterium]|nr:DegT/DnrJ/EryC1/StrS family aminotransferase [Acidobacteriota bacterium]
MRKRAETDIPFSRPTVSRADMAAVMRVLRSGWLTTGPVTAALERAVAERLGVRYAVATSSGTAGLQIALESLGIGPGDEVITTPMTFTATAEAITRAGARPVFCDITPGTLNIDPVAVARRITKKTRAMVPVGIGGIPCEMTALRRSARQHGMVIVEDAAHSLGATYHDRPIGRWAQATVFSFYATKNMTTGEGGMIVTDVRRLAERARLLANHGITRPTWMRETDAGREGYRYDVETLGRKANLSDVAAALGLSQWRRFDRLIAKRRRIADWYRDGLAGCDLIAWPAVPARSLSSCHLCQVLLRIEQLRVGRDRVWSALKQAGIECGVHFIPLHHFTYYRRTFGLKPQQFPVTEDAYRRVLTLPSYPAMTRRQVRQVTETLVAVLEAHRR